MPQKRNSLKAGPLYAPYNRYELIATSKIYRKLGERCTAEIAL